MLSEKTDQMLNVLVVGVGGQGVIMVSKVLAQLGQRQGLQVKQSEVHGMAKRGGVVFSHVRLGREVWSPTIAQGQADVLLAMEWAEGLRWLPYLNLGHGLFIADTQRIIPPFACFNRKRGAASRYTSKSVAEVVERVPNVLAVDAAGIARVLGNERASNTVLLGILSTALDFPEQDWLDVILQSVPPKTVELNRQAFFEGRNWARSESRDLPAEEPLPSAGMPVGGVHLDIESSWCKGCDICVKMCPERCLRLNASEIVELTDPEACTGCRICEMLCPDFAITVRIDPAPGARQPEMLGHA